MSTAAPVPRPPLPAWAEVVRRKYVADEASMFVLYGNVYDEILWNGRYQTLTEFLTEVLLQDNKDTIIVFDPSAGVRYAKRSSSLPETSWPAEFTADQMLARMEDEVLVRHRLALIVPYAGSVAPPGEENFLSDSDRRAAIRLHRWTLSPQFKRRDNVVFLLVESLSELNAKIVANPRVAAVELPLPDTAQRTEVIRLASHSSGLRAAQIAQILTPSPADDLPDDERLRYVASLLGDTPDAAARAHKLAALTRGMDAGEIRHLINPQHPPKRNAPA